jgi:hypothetical protein
MDQINKRLKLMTKLNLWLNCDQIYIW